MRSFSGLEKNACGAFSSTISPSSMNITRSATCRAKPISCVTQHGHAFIGQFHHHVQHFLNHFRVKRRGWFIEQHDTRVHAKRARNGDTLLLTPIAGRDICPLGRVRTRSIIHAPISRPRLAIFAAPKSVTKCSFSSTVICGNKLNC